MSQQIRTGQGFDIPVPAGMSLRAASVMDGSVCSLAPC